VNANYLKKWEKDVFVEIFDSEDKRIIKQDAGVRIYGGMTRLYPEKSLRIIARKSYGTSRFNANIFRDGKKEYKQFILRHSGNDYRKTRFKDALAATLAAESNLDVQKSEPCHLFVNSEYWGVYNIREKINKFYFENNYDIDKTGIDILQGYKRVEEGDNKEYMKLLDYIRNNGLKDSIHYKKVNELMDVRSYINFWVNQLYFSNPDVRGNIRWWRSDSLDGKFRWIVYDTDLGFVPGRSKRDFLSDFTSSFKTNWYNANWVTFLLRNLLKNEQFKKDFINQSCYILSSSLSSKNVLNIINDFEELYENEMKLHFTYRREFQRNQGSIESWKVHVDNLRRFAISKPNHFYDHLKRKFNLNETYILNISIANYKYGQVLLNNNKIKTNSFTGKFYTDYNVPINIIPNIGYSYEGWSLDEVSNITGDTINISIAFKANKNSINKVIINEINYTDDWIELFNPTEETINLLDWQIVDKNQNSFKINDCKLYSKQFAVLHYNSISKNRLGSVIYQEISFKMHGNSESIGLYDNKENLVDSVTYKLTTSESRNSYLRNIPYDSLPGIQLEWYFSDTSSMGKHNPFFINFQHEQKLLKAQSAKIEAKRNKLKTFWLYASSVVMLIFLSILLLRKHIL